MKQETMLKLRAEESDARMETLNRWRSETNDWYLLGHLNLAAKGLQIKRVHKTTYQEQKIAVTAMRERSKKTATNNGAKWSEDDRQMIMESDLKDEELGKILGRSMQAVGQQRVTLRKKFGTPIMTPNKPESTPTTS